MKEEEKKFEKKTNVVLKKKKNSENAPSEKKQLLFSKKRKESQNEPLSNSEVMEKVRQLRKFFNHPEKKPKVTFESLSLENACKEVVEMHENDVAKKIEELILQIAKSILQDKGFSFTLPSRSNSNQLYISELDRIVLGNAGKRISKTDQMKIIVFHFLAHLFLTPQVSVRDFSNASTVRKATITTRILQLVHEVVSKRIHITKRDLFYTDVKLFQKQSESDPVIDDLACMVGCTRSSLNVVASEKVRFHSIVLDSYEIY
eukprot:Sdes_comp20155_c0_seq3m13300